MDDQDLFGSSDEDDNRQPLNEPLNNTEDSSSMTGGVENISSLNVQIPDFDKIDSQGDKLYLVKLPNFLHVEPTPFEAATFDIAEKTRDVENTLRWKYMRDQSGNVIGKKSNARLVKWQDGSMSMLIGQESFDVTVKSIQQENQYLIAQHPNDGVLHAQARFDRSMTFKPSSTATATHNRLTKSFRQNKIVKTKAYTPATHPEQELREVEKLENEKMKARRRLEAKRRSAAGKFGSSLTEQGLEYESEDEAFGRDRQQAYERYEDDEDDDIVVDDDDEQVREERILKAKRRDDSDDDDNAESDRKTKRARDDNDQADESADDAVAVKKSGNKKRAVLESESD